MVTNHPFVMSPPLPSPEGARELLGRGYITWTRYLDIEAERERQTKAAFYDESHSKE